jgi:hypothetical protein
MQIKQKYTWIDKFKRDRLSKAIHASLALTLIAYGYLVIWRTLCLGFIYKLSYEETVQMNIEAGLSPLYSKGIIFGLIMLCITLMFISNLSQMVNVNEVNTINGKKLEEKTELKIQANKKRILILYVTGSISISIFFFGSLILSELLVVGLVMKNLIIPIMFFSFFLIGMYLNRLGFKLNLETRKLFYREMFGFNFIDDDQKSQNS